MVQNIVIGTPLVPLESLGVTANEETVYEKERFLPRLLVKYGFFPSISELKRNRKDLVRTLDKPDMEQIKIGKKKVWIITGITMDYQEAWERLKDEMQESKEYAKTLNTTADITINKNIAIINICDNVLSAMEKIEKDLSNK